MKILHVGPVYSNRSSGPSFSILGLAKGEASIGCEVALLPSEPHGINGKAVGNDIELIAGPNKRHLNPWKVSKDWIKVIRENFGEPDIINFHDTYIPFQTALAKLFIKEGWPYVLTPRGGLTRLAQGIKSLKKRVGNLFFFKHFVMNARAIHVLCENEAADVRFFYPKANIFIVPNGIDEDLFLLSSRLSSKNLKEFRKEGDLVLGFIGRIDIYHKGIDLLLLSLKFLQDRGLGENIKLLMIGPFYTPKDEQQIKKLIGTLRFPDNIMLAGPEYGDEKWRLLLACDVFVHTSRFEGMPMAVIEAMAFGKPCIVTPGSNMQAVISECNGGWLCDLSVNSIADTLLRVYEEKETTLERGENAKKYTQSHLTWPTLAQQWLANVHEILNVGEYYDKI